MKLTKKFKFWIFKTFLERYLVSVDEKFIEFFIKNLEKKPIPKIESYAEREYTRIMKTLSSKKFRKHFYKVINYNMDYNIENDVQLIKPYGVSLKDKIFSFIADKYLMFFNKKWYISIQKFKKFRDNCGTLDEKINMYMNNTTIEERLDRATMIFGIVNSEIREAEIMMRNIQSIKVSNIKESNQYKL